MTIKELYEWAIQNNVENADIVVYDYDGAKTSYIEPTIIQHNGYVDVEVM